MNIRVCAFTIACGEQAVIQAVQLRKTFKHVHRDIPFFIIDQSNFEFLTGQDRPYRICEVVAMRALIGMFLSMFFERVLYLDSDIVVFAPLDALLECEHEAVLTNDILNCPLGPEGAPAVNSGVVAARSLDFWIAWVGAIYQHIFPLVNTMGDQYALRLVARDHPEQYRLLPETEKRTFYNNGFLTHPGEMRREGDRVFRGDAELKLFHWAGQKIKDLSILPPEVARLVEECPTYDEVYLEDMLLWDGLKKKEGPSMLPMIVQFFKSLPVKIYSDPAVQHIYDVFSGMGWSYAPMSLERLRAGYPEGYAPVLSPSDKYYYILDIRANPDMKTLMDKIPDYEKRVRRKSADADS